MPTLFVLTGKLVGRTFDVHQEVTLGRAATCAVRLPDASVSREHARIERDDEGDWWLVDLGSRNGVRVNGEREERTLLKDLDEVMLGELLLRFRTDEPPAAAEIAPPAQASEPARPPEPRPAPGASTQRAEEESGFELEEEIELGETRLTPKAPAPRPALELTERDRARARILSESRSGGVLTGDLAQWPAPLRWTAYLLVLALTAGMFYGAYRLVMAMRGM